MNFKYFTFYAAFAIISLIRCNGSHKDNVFDNIIRYNEFPTIERIAFQELYDYDKGEPTDLLVTDSIIIIQNEGHNNLYFYYNYNIANKVLDSGYIAQGRGPKEGLGCSSPCLYDNKLWINDVTIKKLICIDVGMNPDLSKITEYYYRKFYTSIALIDSVTFISVNNPYRFSKINYIDLKSEIVKDSLGLFKNSEGIPLDAYRDAYTQYIKLKPSGNRLVLAYRYTDVIEIFDINSRTSKAIQGPECFKVKFDVGSRDGINYMIKTKKTRKSFINMSVTNKYIYLLYSGHYYEDENWSYGKYIYIYDWDGHPVKCLELDRYVYTIGVSPNDELIYSFDMETGQLINTNIIL